MTSFLEGIKRQKQFSSELSISNIPLKKIAADPDQVRKAFDEDKIKELADSIREKGIQNPIHVRLSDKQEEYIIITGERRYRAAQIVELDTIPCIVHSEPLSTKEIRSLQLIENLQRQDLNVVEKAKGFEMLIQEGMSQREVARGLGIPEGTVSKSIAILKKLPVDWIAEIEKICKEKQDIPLYQIYEVAKERNKNRRKVLFDKLVKESGEIITEEPAILEEEQPDKEKIKKDRLDEQFNSEEVWEALKKIARKDKELLLQYFSPKKLKKLLDDIDV